LPIISDARITDGHNIIIELAHSQTRNLMLTNELPRLADSSGPATDPPIRLRMSTASGIEKRIVMRHVGLR
jgi:hypothetical protein